MTNGSAASFVVDADGNAGADDETAPLPVILPQRISQDQREAPPLVESAAPGQSHDQDSKAGAEVGEDPQTHRQAQVRGNGNSSATRTRGPFEPVARAQTGAEDPASAAASAVDSVEVPGEAKLDQIKDLYLTAEAIGEDALAKHFEQVSQRQRQLIKEYFQEAVSERRQAQAEGAQAEDAQAHQAQAEPEQAEPAQAEPEQADESRAVDEASTAG